MYKGAAALTRKHSAAKTFSACEHKLFDSVQSVQLRTRTSDEGKKRCWTISGAGEYVDHDSYFSWSANQTFYRAKQNFSRLWRAVDVWKDGELAVVGGVTSVSGCGEAVPQLERRLDPLTLCSSSSSSPWNVQILGCTNCRYTTKIPAMLFWFWRCCFSLSRGSAFHHFVPTVEWKRESRTNNTCTYHQFTWGLGKFIKLISQLKGYQKYPEAKA